MTHTPVTDKFINRLSAMCKRAGYKVPTANEIKLRKAAEQVESAKMRVLARELKKFASIQKKINQLTKANKNK